MANRLPRMVAGDEGLKAAWNELVRLVEPLLDGPEVCAPLIKIDGVLALGEDHAIQHFIVSSEIGAMVGDTMGVGKARLCRARGAAASAGQGPEFTIYNNTFGVIEVGTRGLCAAVDDQMQVLEAACGEDE